MRATKLSLDIHETVFDERLVHITNDRVNSTSKVRHHIFMITGNPGCIGYYHEFLTLLWNELGTLSKGTDLSVFGVSMSRFTDDGRRAVLGLQGQIDYLESRLREYIEQYVVIDSSVEHNVIIIGHSVGAYIGLELIRRHQDQSRKGSNRGFQVIGYVGLWPTVTHIAQSKRGRTVGVRCISVPYD